MINTNVIALVANSIGIDRNTPISPVETDKLTIEKIIENSAKKPKIMLVINYFIFISPIP
ncbi:MAG: hypothetical protein LBV51_02100 [Acholeplasmatales bacterium]|jgi:hypothetical protein|nr:hypothetical protein [Acholeplasmatales bacterium]